MEAKPERNMVVTVVNEDTGRCETKRKRLTRIKGERKNYITSSKGNGKRKEKIM